MRLLALLNSMLWLCCVAGLLYRSGAVCGPRWAQRRARRTAEWLRWSDELLLGWSAAKAGRLYSLLHAGIGGGAVVLWWLSGSWLFAVAAAFGALRLPRLLFQRARDERRERIEAQLPDTVSLMVSSARAGRSLRQAIGDVAEKASGPLAEEFRLISQAIEQGGLSVEKALARAQARVAVESFQMIATALLINCAKGGDVLHILERMAEATRELGRLRQKILTETSEVRAQEKVILLLTPLFGVLICLFDADIPRILFSTLPGNLILVTVAGLQIACVLWIRRIIRAAI